ncbi:MAG TPA: SAM-dependent methyltransferase [Actinocrinis sp.]|jgi:hypothetical protein
MTELSGERPEQGAGTGDGAASGFGGDRGDAPGGVDTSKPNPARMYDYFLGGYDNYEADREAGDEVLARAPEFRPGARATRAFMHRAVRFMAEQGMHQFLDIGTGMPTAPNVHDTVRTVHPDARVVYVDNDPIVRVHGQARLSRAGSTYFVEADLREPERILNDPGVRALIDFGEPVGLVLSSVMHFVEDRDDPAGIVARLRDALVPGSYMTLSHITADFSSKQEEILTAAGVYDKTTARMLMRSKKQVLPMFDGFELVEPGLVQLSRWRPNGPVVPNSDELDIGIIGYGGVGRKI